MLKDRIEDMSDCFEALGNVGRIKIIEYLKGKGDVTVGDVGLAVGVTNSVASHAL